MGLIWVSRHEVEGENVFSGPGVKDAYREAQITDITQKWRANEIARFLRNHPEFEAKDEDRLLDAMERCPEFNNDWYRLELWWAESKCVGVREAYYTRTRH